MSTLEKRYREILAEIGDTKLVAVSKQQPLEKIQELYQLGQRDFGENYVQELVSKAEQLKDQGYTDIRWHFIGQLQRNKVKQVIPHLSMVHSLDSLAIAQELNKRWKHEEPLVVLIQVNIDEEVSKGGILPGDLEALSQKITDLHNLSLRGLMCIPRPHSGSKPFERLRKLAETLGLSHPLLSMGMSDDYSEAISCGATHIRIGSSLMGNRP